jgi:hypothetical protein
VVNTTLITTVARCKRLGTTQCLGSCCSTGPAANAMVCIAATPNPNCAGNPCVTQLPNSVRRGLEGLRIVDLQASARIWMARWRLIFPRHIDGVITVVRVPPGLFETRQRYALDP